MPFRIRLIVVSLSLAYCAILVMGLYLGCTVTAFLWFLLGLLVLDLYWPRFDLAGETWARGNPKLATVALTFDDGPDPRHTPGLLDLLRRLDVRATFFVLGKHAKEHPAIVQRILAEGHEIGCHGFDHTKYTKLGPAGIERDLLAWEETVIPLNNGKRPAWLRPPHGLKHMFVRRIARRHGMRLAAWTKGAWDTDRPGADVIARRALCDVRNGDVLLLHDGDGSGSGADRSQTVAAVDPIVEGLRKRGMSLVTISELFSRARKPIPWGKLLIGTAISVMLIGYIVRNFDIREIVRHLSVSAPRFLVAALCLDLACLFVKSQAWREFVLPLAPLKRIRAFMIYLVGAMLNNVLPLRGGDLGRADLLGRKEDVRRLHGYSTILLEGILNGVSILPILFVCVFLFPLQEPLGRMLKYFSFMMAGIVAAMFLLSSKSEHRWLKGLRGFREWRAVSFAFLYLLSAWAIYLVSLTCMLRACGLSVPLWAAPVIALALAGSMFVPAAPGRLGAFEAAIALSLALFSVPAEKALGFAIVLHAVQTIPTILWGGIAWFFMEAKGGSK